MKLRNLLPVTLLSLMLIAGPPQAVAADAASLMPPLKCKRCDCCR